VRAALQAHGLILPESHVIEQPFSFEGGRAGLRAAMALEPRPTALICSTDILSFGACDEARRMGVEVPADVSITGFDDISFAAMCVPALTTVRVPIVEIGNRSADALIAQIEGDKPPLHECLEIRLVIRESTAPASQHIP